MRKHAGTFHPRDFVSAQRRSLFDYGRGAHAWGTLEILHRASPLGSFGDPVKLPEMIIPHNKANCPVLVTILGFLLQRLLHEHFINVLDSSAHVHPVLLRNNRIPSLLGVVQRVRTHTNYQTTTREVLFYSLENPHVAFVKAVVGTERDNRLGHCRFRFCQLAARARTKIKIKIILCINDIIYLEFIYLFILLFIYYY